MSNTTIQIRTDMEVKETVGSIFKQMGMTMSDGINIFLRQVQMNRGFPFEVNEVNEVKIQDRSRLKKWTGILPDMENPVHIKNYQKISREELYAER